jgi:hypothetical protein
MGMNDENERTPPEGNQTVLNRGFQGFQGYQESPTGPQGPTGPPGCAGEPGGVTGACDKGACQDGPTDNCEKTQPPVLLKFNNYSLTLAAAEHQAATQFGLDNKLLTKLLEVFGPDIVKALLAALAKRMLFGGVFEDLGLSVLKDTARQMLLAMKDKLAEEAKAVVDQLLQKLADLVAAK